MGWKLEKLGGIGIDFWGKILSIEKDVEIDEGDKFIERIGNEKVERGRREWINEDWINIGVDNRLDLMDLSMRIEMRIGNNKVIEKKLIIKMLKLIENSVISMINKGRKGIDIWKEKNIRRIEI